MPLPCDHSAAVPRDEYEGEAGPANRESDDDAAVERQMSRLAKQELEKAITKDAQRNIDEGVLEGPAIIETTCEPIGGAASNTQRYDCLAANEKRGGGVYAGYDYDGTANTKSGNITWELGD